MKMAAGKEVPHFTEQQALRYFRQLVLAIEYCGCFVIPNPSSVGFSSLVFIDILSAIVHFQKIIHRDIKPENILLNGNDEIQLADFGVAHIFEGEDWLQNSQGSPAFSPPEVCSSRPILTFPGKSQVKEVDQLFS